MGVAELNEDDESEPLGELELVPVQEADSELSKLEDELAELEAEGSAEMVGVAVPLGDSVAEGDQLEVDDPVEVGVDVGVALGVPSSEPVDAAVKEDVGDRAGVTEPLCVVDPVEEPTEAEGVGIEEALLSMVAEPDGEAVADRDVLYAEAVGADVWVDLEKWEADAEGEGVSDAAADELAVMNVVDEAEGLPDWELLGLLVKLAAEELVASADGRPERLEREVLDAVEVALPVLLPKALLVAVESAVAVNAAD